MTVIREILSIELGNQEKHTYKAGDVLKIPVDTKMNVKNLHENVLELIIIKAPAPI